MQKEKYFFGIIAIDGKLESYIGPLMPQTQRANTCLYQQCEKQIHLLSQIHPLTALSQSGLRNTVQVTEATAGPRGGQQPVGPGQGQEHSYSPCTTSAPHQPPVEVKPAFKEVNLY